MDGELSSSASYEKCEVEFKIISEQSLVVSEKDFCEADVKPT